MYYVSKRILCLDNTIETIDKCFLPVGESWGVKMGLFLALRCCKPNWWLERKCVPDLLVHTRASLLGLGPLAVTEGQMSRTGFPLPSAVCALLHVFCFWEGPVLTGK